MNRTFNQQPYVMKLHLDRRIRGYDPTSQKTIIIPSEVYEVRVETMTLSLRDGPLPFVIITGNEFNGVCIACRYLNQFDDGTVTLTAP